jgi:deoxyadenosine/deoxycytidine kinase
MGNHIVYIEGNIAAGKTTVLGELEKRGYTVVREAVDEWTFFERCKKDAKRWSTTFETQVMLSMVRKIEEKVKTARKWPVFVERSIASAYVFSKVAFVNGAIEKEELDLLADLGRALSERLNMYSSSSLYLDCSPQVCRERIARRARKGEEGITTEYLECIEKMHGTEWIMIDATQCTEAVVEDVLRHTT